MQIGYYTIQYTCHNNYLSSFSYVNYSVYKALHAITIMQVTFWYVSYLERGIKCIKVYIQTWRSVQTLQSGRPGLTRNLYNCGLLLRVEWAVCVTSMCTRVTSMCVSQVLDSRTSLKIQLEPAWVTRQPSASWFLTWGRMYLQPHRHRLILYL